MTCIAGMIENGVVYLGADSMVTTGYITQVLAGRKLMRQKQCLLGWSGDVRGMNLLADAFAVPEHPQDMPVERYLTTLFVDALRTTLKDAGAAKKESEKEQTAGYFLLGYQSRLFEIGCDYSVLEVAEGFNAIGNGSEVALGALHATRHLSLSPQVRLTMALEAAAHFCNGVSSPFIIESLEPEKCAPIIIYGQAHIDGVQHKAFNSIQAMDLKLHFEPDRSARGIITKGV